MDHPLGFDTDALRDRLTAEPIEVAIVFGSHVEGTATDESDVDIAVEFSDQLSESEKFDHKIRLMGVLPTVLDVGEVDVSDFDRLPPDIGLTAVNDGVLVVGTEERVEQIRDRFEAAYPDFRENIERGKKELLERIEAGTYGK